MRRRLRVSVTRRGCFWGLTLLVLLLGRARASPGEELRVAVDQEFVAVLTEENEIFLAASPQTGEGLLAFTRRFTGDQRAAQEVSQFNDGVKHLAAGTRYKVPYARLLDEYRLRLIRALFPNDQARADGWLHVVGPTQQGLSLWRVAEWWTGRGENFRALREFNQLKDDTLTPGQNLVIPAELLLPGFRAALPPSEVAYQLEYGRDDAGEFAVYRLRPGEALYSSVVVRFTGRTFAEDVNALAAELATLNQIPDVTDIPIGQRIRIPYEHLLPEYLPVGHPRRAEYEQARAESERYSNTVQTTRLEGITVILDPGHGGQDPGAMRDGVWESLYVYDIALRVKARLEAFTAATVLTTVKDGESYKIADRDVLPISRGHAVLTLPKYPIEDAKVGVNLRWYLANSLHAQAARKSGDPAKTVFLSLHADSLHPSLRGAMAYIPSAALTQGEYERTGGIYTLRREVKERPKVSFSREERVKSEGLSRQLAQRLIASLRRRSLAVHTEKPIRDRIVRSRHAIFVPAVLRYNAVPAKLLLEVVNLNNAEDRKLLKTRSFRQRVADAVVDGILEYYGEAPASASPAAAP